MDEKMQDIIRHMNEINDMIHSDDDATANQGVEWQFQAMSAIPENIEWCSKCESWEDTNFPCPIDVENGFA